MVYFGLSFGVVFYFARCCTVRSDLAPIIQKLYLGQAETGKLDGILVETTGLAVPNPVAQTFLTDLPAMVTRLDAVVTLVDSLNAERHLEQERQAPEGLPHGETVNEMGFKETALGPETGVASADEEVAAAGEP